MKAFSLAALSLVLTSGLPLAPVAKAQSVDNSGDRKVVRKTTPPYPAIARTLNLSGSVKLEVTVASNGSVKAIQVLGGNPLLAEVACAAVHDWKWEKVDRETTERVEVRFNP